MMSRLAALVLVVVVRREQQQRQGRGIRAHVAGHEAHLGAAGLALLRDFANVFEASGSRLRVVGCAGVEIDNVDLAAATEHGCLILNGW
ncbi:hypothetical protein C2845_PM15G22730 [Panicum miliaceum]|uniref:D-isomer specific 2-hydroxyacid dehydrogenase catalytic domain-containing protein n=1 Tax=Panicum miliaceum TaxID=4540 RepID=A0A3L6Q5Q3_PANMI|nr:hypothetical protein C2845_PM15G22730 [Panicum miliaceum]